MEFAVMTVAFGILAMLFGYGFASVIAPARQPQSDADHERWQRSMTEAPEKSEPHFSEDDYSTAAIQSLDRYTKEGPPYWSSEAEVAAYFQHMADQRARALAMTDKHWGKAYLKWINYFEHEQGERWERERAMKKSMARANELKKLRPPQ
jgi:hypothetical protein